MNSLYMEELIKMVNDNDEFIDIVKDISNIEQIII